MSSLLMYYYVNCWNKNGIRHVMDAIERHDLDWLKQLSDYGAMLHHNEANQYLRHLLLRSDHYQDRRNMSYLCSLDSSVWVRPLYLEPPIALAVRLNNIHIVEYLLSQNIDVNACQGNGNTLLHLAVKNRNVDMIQLLLNHHADPNIPNILGVTAIWDVIADNYNIVELLMKHGAKVTYKNFEGWTLLHEISYQNNFCALPMLLEHGCEINTRDWDGKTLLYNALFFNHDKIKCDDIRTLLKHGADPTIAERRGDTPIKKAQKYKLTEINELFDAWLIENLLD
jgi:uncharacterized protein